MGFQSPFPIFINTPEMSDTINSLTSLHFFAFPDCNFTPNHTHCHTFRCKTLPDRFNFILIGCDNTSRKSALSSRDEKIPGYSPRTKTGNRDADPITTEDALVLAAFSSAPSAAADTVDMDSNCACTSKASPGCNCGTTHEMVRFISSHTPPLRDILAERPSTCGGTASIMTKLRRACSLLGLARILNPTRLNLLDTWTRLLTS